MKIKKISLRTLNDEVLAANELSHILGGADDCGCGCNGPSSWSANLSANYGSGLISPGACNYTGYDGENPEIVVRPHA
ncbi:MAG: rSAM-modified peptide [Bacteroidales bacterium]|nr:rSAM-modified peptide [Bacteroidales bacterium]